MEKRLISKQGAMAGGRAAGAAAFLMKRLRETKGKINKDSCVFERVATMDYSIVPDESVPEGTVIVGLNKDDKVDIEKQDKLNQELQKELLAIKKGALDDAVETASKISVIAAVAEIGLNAVGLGLNLMESPRETVTKVVKKVLWEDQRELKGVDKAINDRVEECGEVAGRIHQKI